MESHKLNELVQNQIYYAYNYLDPNHLLRFKHYSERGTPQYEVVKGCEIFILHDNGLIGFSKNHFPNIPYLEKADA